MVQPRIKTVEELNEKLTDPSGRLIEDLSDLDGDILILGAGGKMGPSLAVLARKALRLAGCSGNVIGVSRFSDEALRKWLDEQGVKTYQADLLNEETLQSLPDAKYVIFMVGMKFGTSGNEYVTWALNSYLPGRVADKYHRSSIVAFSTGNVYPFIRVENGGATENDPTGPVGEYAQSCLGRERIFEYFSRNNGTPLLLFRLNYATELRYGVLLEVARSVQRGKPIDLRTGHVNVIWQGDANEIALRCLKRCSSPPQILNVTGPETISVRWLAEEFGRHFNKTPIFEGKEEPTSLLSDASKARRLFGPPLISLEQMIAWTVEWIKRDGETLGKPTHFQHRKGKF